MMMCLMMKDLVQRSARPESSISAQDIPPEIISPFSCVEYALLISTNNLTNFDALNSTIFVFTLFCCLFFFCYLITVNLVC